MNEKQKEITETIKAECEKNEDYQKGFITGMFYAAHISKGDTNFAKVTESPEALAKFIEDVTLICYGCKAIFAEYCPHRKRNGVMFCDKKECAKWLKQESDTE